MKNLDIAVGQIKSAGAIPNPQFAMQYGFGTPYTEIIAGNTQTVGVNQLIEMGGKRGARLKLARANLSLIKAQLDALRIDVRSKVRKQYAELAAAEANIELVENQRKLVERLYLIALKKVKTKSAPESEALHARLSVEQFETLRTLALSRLRQASVKLDYLIGYKADRDLDVEDNGLFTLSSQRTELVPQPDYNIPPLQELLARAYAQRPDLMAALQKNIANKWAIKLAKAQAIPDVLIGSGYVFSTFKKNQMVSPQNGAYLNVNVDMPIFYRHQGEIAQAKANMSQSRLQLAQLTAQVETDVHTAYSDLIAARSNITQYQKILIPHAREVVRLSQLGYEKGKNDLTDAIVAQQQFQQTLSGYFDTVVDYQEAWADLEHSVGTPVTF